jgi:single-strand DNA-binding protein
MASMNKVLLLGHLGADPELRYTQNQTAVCNFRIATTDYKTDKDGNKQEFTEWHSIVTWQKLAENCGKYLLKGRQVLVEGRLQTRKWQDKEGKDRWTTEIVAEQVKFVGGNPNAAEGKPAAASGQKPAAQQHEGPLPGMDEIPF